MGIIQALTVKRRSAERELAEEVTAKLRDAGWTPPGESWRLRDALDHIKRTAYHSRTQTRRLRWIARRADLALKNEDFTFEATSEPVQAPCLAALEKQLAFEQRENARLRAQLSDEIYGTPCEETREMERIEKTFRETT